MTLIANLDHEFSLKDLGPLSYFLGIEVKRYKDGSLHLVQTKYLKDILSRAGMVNTKGVVTPMTVGLKLFKHGSDVMINPQLYRSIVGALQYATITRPEISFAVNKVCQFMQNPLMSHWKAVKRILRYIAGTLTHGIILRPCTNRAITAYCDADWASDCNDRHSTTGFCIYFGTNLVAWSSKKQATMARSSTEAEYRSMASTVTEVLWIKSLLQELRVALSGPARVLCDNLSTVMMTANPILHARTKHIELDLHFVREKAIKKEFIVQHIPSQDQVADGMTKALSQSTFLDFKRYLCISDNDISSSSKG
ncbi:uncharacterized protein LOC114754339 [Neltuma alba]|uniref:uncharacterized protein LOC114754339 n=1 Tax=Neltuma alba TaxID=207710 RepID=UPI0010A4C4DF|nr:uncharacterized protein LOC114754339 [Prosopis alba]